MEIGKILGGLIFFGLSLYILITMEDMSARIVGGVLGLIGVLLLFVGLITSLKK